MKSLKSKAVFVLLSSGIILTSFYPFIYSFLNDSLTYMQVLKETILVIAIGFVLVLISLAMLPENMRNPK